MSPSPATDLKSGEKIDQWTVVEKLGEGGFGSVYKKKRILHILGSPNNLVCIRYLRHSYLEDMRKKLPGQKFSMVCALSVGIQCLEAIEELHTIGFLHRDIKPSNYATGRGKLSELRRIYILDFGMCRSYLDEHGRFRPPRKTAGFRGTVRYASLSSHIRRETCRKDDIESWLYQQIEVTRGALPWCSLDDKKDDVAMFKERCRFETGLQELMGGCPQEYIEILRYIDSLRFYDNPNYKKSTRVNLKRNEYVAGNFYQPNFIENFLANEESNVGASDRQTLSQTSIHTPLLIHQNMLPPNGTADELFTNSDEKFVNMTMAQRNEMMTDADLLDAIQALGEQEPHDEVKELLTMMSDNRIITWEEAEQIMACNTYNRPIKSSLPQQTRPMEPDNDTDVDWSIQQLQMDNPKLKQVNLNNMKRTPIPQVKRLLSAIKIIHIWKKLHSLTWPIFDVIASNTTLKSINLETNYLSGDFFARLFKAALVNQTLEEVKAVNQGVTFATAAEKEIIDAVFENRGLTKVSINLRLPEGRILRRQAAAAIREAEEVQKKNEKVNKPVAANQEILFRKLQPMKPTILGNTSQVPSEKKQLPIIGDSILASTDITRSSVKTPPVIIGNRARTSPHMTESEKKTTSAVPEKALNASRQAKNSNVVNRITANKVFEKTSTLTESPPIINSAKITTSKKTGLKRACTRIKTADTITETAPGRAKSKKVVPRKISVEQAVPEVELDTEEVLREVTFMEIIFRFLCQKIFIYYKRKLRPFGLNETASPAFVGSILSRWQNNSKDDSKRNNSKVPEEIEFNTPKHNSYQNFDKKSARMMKILEVLH
ncbi:Tropomodulin [Dirofilaria immitis]|nr:Tropomodulin [Dirofilaria immitis]